MRERGNSDERGFIWGDENLLELDSGGGYPNCEYIKTTEVHCKMFKMNFVLYERYLHKNKRKQKECRPWSQQT